MLNPLVSVIIPVYNGSNYLRQAIDSALSQTYDNCEIVVVDDGSTDSTEEIALSYGNKIKYFKKTNGGVSTALNFGINEMKGEYFSWLSHDDIYYPNKIAKQIHALKECGDMTKITYGDYDMLITNSGEIIARKLGDQHNLEKLQDSIYPIIIGAAAGCGFLIHKSHFDRVGLFDENLRYTQDISMWFRLLRKQKTLYVPFATYIQRVHDEAGSANKSHEQRNEIVKLWLGIMLDVDEYEATRMFGSLYQFYFMFLFSNCFYGNTDIINLISGYVKKHNHERRKRYLEILNKYADKKVCIFCAGSNGKKQYADLLCNDIRVEYFSDNYSMKPVDTIFGTVECIPFTELKKRKDEILVIIANANPLPILEQLEKAQFPNIMTQDELEKYLVEGSQLEIF